MVATEKKYKKRLGVLRGLVTRWENQGYDIDIDYKEPKKITEGSVRRVENLINEVRRQHDVQSGPVSTALKKEIEELDNIANEYKEGIRRGTVGKDNKTGTSGESVNSDTEKNYEYIHEKLREYKKKAGTYEEKKRLLENIKSTKDDLVDFIETIVLALYKSETAVWGGGQKGFNRVKSAFAAAFKHALEEGEI